ncbi:hypothetical protein [Granulibacter bethesdensis]|uniref:outer membrane lipoprotein n=1 Tax=Granulibacter bethesdensis TaxID=364410 RepID=UPI000932D33F|nr:hypothetical protein [Granulibacter bethesdensis]
MFRQSVSARHCLSVLSAAFCAVAVPFLSGCGPSYSPDTYADRAMQQANKVEQGVIVGVRPIGVSIDSSMGTATGAAAGGIAGAQTPGGVGSAFGALGGALVGGIVGTTATHVVGDTKAWEYIVRKTSGDMVSVTQKDEKPLAIGGKVLVIGGNQARIVPDYTVPLLNSKTDSKPAVATPSAEKPATDSTQPAETRPDVTSTPLPSPLSALPAALPGDSPLVKLATMAARLVLPDAKP